MSYDIMEIFNNNVGPKKEPQICKWGYEDLGDDPDKHRWRASWDTGYDHIAIGIFLSAHPVIKRTRCGAWINANGYREATKQPWEEGAPATEWAPFDERWMKRKFVHDGSGSAWAKLTQEEAIKSLAVRLSRWANHIARDVEKARSAARVLQQLRPEWPSYPEHTLSQLSNATLWRPEEQ